MTNLTVSAKDEKRVKALGFLRNRGTDNFSARVLTVNGKITAAQTRCIAEAAEHFGNGVVTFTSRLTVEVQGIHYDKIEDFRAYIAKEGLEVGGTGPKVRPVVSCKGTTCRFGLIDTFSVSEEIHKRFYEGYFDLRLPHKFKIAVGGCPNSCVKPDLNDVGLVGQMIPNYDKDACKGCRKCSVENICPVKAAKVIDGVLEIDKKQCINCGLCIGQCPFNAIEDGQTAYKVYIGGRWGKRRSLGIPLDIVFTSKEEALDIIEKVMLLYKEQGKAGERLAETIERLGFQNVQSQLLSSDILDRKDEILKV